jgi:hypothetical protein
MKRMLTATALFLMLMPAALHGQATEQSRRAELAARRDSLEAEVVRKFVHRLARDLQLDANQRAQTELVLRDSGVRRRDLSRASSQLRSSIYRAVRDTTTAAADFIRLLADYEALSSREHELWRREQDELARILDPRQRAQFLLSWVRFQDDMREILSRRMRELDGSRDRDRRSDGDRSNDDHRPKHPDEMLLAA